MKRVIWLITALLFGSLCAKEVNVDQVKVAYAYNFLKHTTWQNESRLNEYHVLVVSGNERLKNMFSMLASRKLLKDKKIRVSFYTPNGSPKNVQAVYVDRQNGPLYEKLFEAYEPHNVLLISDEYPDQKKVMINLVEEGDIVRFEINKANILNRSLRISPDLILLGGSEIDVAKLYKSSQDELKGQKETIAGLSKKISDINAELAEKSAAVETQKKELAEQKARMALQSATITEQLQNIRGQTEMIAVQRRELADIRQNIDLQRQKLLIEEQNINEKEKVLKDLLQSQNALQQEINDADKELESLNREIEHQKSSLTKKEGVITTQRGVLAALSILFGIIALLIVYVLKQNRLLRELSQTDPLTGLLNRRTLMGKIHEEVLKYNRYETPFSILLMDIDYFKSINDFYGHDTGDTVLKKVASLMEEHTRDTDFCVRWGGEEFMILATNTDLESAMKLAENFRRIVESHDFHLDKTVTLSIGVATIQKGQSEEELVQIADHALYQAKRDGRNGIACLSHRVL